MLSCYYFMIGFYRQKKYCLCRIVNKNQGPIADLPKITAKESKSTISKNQLSTNEDCDKKETKELQ